VSAAIKRLEDPPLLTGRGRYVDVSRAAAHPGVIACLTARDLHTVPTIPLRQEGNPDMPRICKPRLRPIASATSASPSR
jgi:CO/xanthine dehydrogenase Mo-binding subunit